MNSPEGRSANSYTCKNCGKSYPINASLWKHNKKCNIEVDGSFEDLRGFEEMYMINREGRIWSKVYKKEIQHLTNDDGYLYVCLGERGTRRKCFISRLLAFQYIPNDDPAKIQIDHIDRNKLNNSLENLRWVTQKENLMNKVRNGCIYEDVRKNGKTYWKGSYSWYEEDRKIVNQKTSISREVVEKWLEEHKLIHT